MKCPYTVDSEQLTKHTYEYNEEGQCVGETRQLIEKRPFVDCLGHECAVWIDGRCQYRGAVN